MPNLPRIGEGARATREAVSAHARGFQRGAQALRDGDQARRRADHDGELLDLAVGVRTQEVDALQRAVPGARVEQQSVDAFAFELIGVAEVLQDVEYGPQDGRDGFPALVGLEHRRAAEDDVLREQADGRVHVGPLDRDAEGMTGHATVSPRASGTRAGAGGPDGTRASAT